MAQDTLTHTQYDQLVTDLASELRSETQEMLLKERENILTTCTRLMNRVSCENHWDNEINGWTPEGKIAIRVATDAVATCSAQVFSMMGFYSIGAHTDAYIFFRALCAKINRAWQPPSETYLCA